MLSILTWQKLKVVGLNLAKLKRLLVLVGFILSKISHSVVLNMEKIKSDQIKAYKSIVGGVHQNSPLLYWLVAVSTIYDIADKPLWKHFDVLFLKTIKSVV